MYHRAYGSLDLALAITTVPLLRAFLLLGAGLLRLGRELRRRR